MFAIAGIAIGLGTGTGWSQPKPATPPAQAKPPTPAAPVPAEPQSTSATFGDWVLRCERPPNAPATRICEVAQSIVVQGQQGPIAQVAFGRPAAGDPMHLTLLLPANIAIAARPRISLDDKDGQPFQLTWRRCLPGGCFADTNITDEDMRRLKGRETGGKITYKDAAERDTTIPLSWRGLAQALDALGKS
jgi:invasion protein IalB